MLPWVVAGLVGPSLKKQIMLVGGIILALLVLPFIILSSATNLSALAVIGTYLYSGPTNSTDLYDFGECTYWAALRRQQIGEPIPNTWGNAITWASRARAMGYVVDHTPSYGAIMQDPNAPGGLGHVAFVESVDPVSGDWTISEMNRVGWDEVDWRTLPPAAAAKYNFIHQPL